MIASSLVLLLYFMARTSILSFLRRWCKGCPGAPRYHRVAMDELGSMEMSRLSAADAHILDEDEEETIFEASGGALKLRR